MFNDRGILLLAIGQTLVWAALFYSFPALLPRWEQDLGWSKADLTAAISLALLLSAICSPLAGRIIDKGLGARLMLLSAITGGFGLVLLSRVSDLWLFYIAWALIGSTLAGCLYEPCFAIVTRARGANAKRSIIWITLTAGFASTISFPGIHVLSDAVGWRSALFIVGILVIFIVAPILWAGANTLEHASRDRFTVSASRSGHEHSRSFLHSPVFWFLALGFALLAMVHGAVLHHLLPIFHDKGLSSASAVLAASFIGPMQVLGRLVMMASEKHTSHHVLTMLCFGSMGASIVFLVYSDQTTWFIAMFVLLFAGGHGVTSILRPLVARDLLGENDFGAKSGALAMPYLVGSASAPYVGSMVWGIGGYNLMLGILVLLALFGFALYCLAGFIPDAGTADE